MFAKYNPQLPLVSLLQPLSFGAFIQLPSLTQQDFIFHNVGQCINHLDIEIFMGFQLKMMTLRFEQTKIFIFKTQLPWGFSSEKFTYTKKDPLVQPAV